MSAPEELGHPHLEAIRPEASRERDPSSSADQWPGADPAAVEALRGVIDPELGINVVDLGLVYAARTSDSRVDVELTMTSPACPMGAFIADQAEEALRRAFPGRQVEVALVWDPPWGPERLTPAAKLRLGWE